MIRNMRAADWDEVSIIYQEGIETGTASFRSPEMNWKDWDSSHIKACRFVACQGKEIIGWIALLPVSVKYDMVGVAEVEVYVKHSHKCKGIGSSLMDKLVKESEAAGIWMLQAGIFLQNSAVLRIHEKAGFRVVGYREKIGKANGIWQDNLLLERRNKLIA
ncbi:GNAT family N-acetyltransferase [Pedobacter sp. GSP4]|uniref:GNAT family N-acetyltransferase n=1 Tax=Pedobacter sp. GSP4 TaxID=3453716 RepID=UPI003EEB86A4